MTILLKYLNNYILKKINKNSKNNTYFLKNLEFVQKYGTEKTKNTFNSNAQYESLCCSFTEQSTKMAKHT